VEGLPNISAKWRLGWMHEQAFYFNEIKSFSCSPSQMDATSGK
jgi:hypothetical protein